MKFPSLLLLLVCGCCVRISAQDIAGIGAEKTWESSGFFNASTTLLQSNRPKDLRDPFTWYLSGGITPSFKGFKIPLSFTLSQGNSGFNVPSFQRFGASPYYKWVKIHAGWRNMNFSKYTLNGYSFLGGGLELTPGIFRISAMAGRLENQWLQPSESLLGDRETLDLYRRRAWAVKVGIAGEVNRFSVTVFQAQDVPNTGALDSLGKYLIPPAANLAFGPEFELRLLKRIYLAGEGALSAVTFNQNSPDFEDVGEEFTRRIELVDPLLDLNRSSRYFFGGEGSLRYRHRGFELGLRYQRVDPYFTTFGVYYLPRDYEHYTGFVNAAIFKNTLNLRLTLGFQRNNVREQLSNTTLRRVSSANVQWNPGKTFRLAASYSNLNTDQEAGLLEVNDTLRVAALNQSLSVRPSLTFKRGDRTQRLSLRYRESSFEDLNPVSGSAGNETQSASFDYSLRNKETKLRFSVALTYRNTNFRNNDNRRIGGKVGLGRQWLDDKLTTRLRSTWQNSQFNGAPDGYILNNQLIISYQLPRQQRIRFSNRILFRRTLVQTAYNEWRGTLGYNISF